MIDVNRLCMGCMRQRENGEEICSYCGYDNRVGDDRSVKCLTKDTILNGRYLVGRVLGEGGFGITYLAIDLVEEARVAIKEYFPVGLASRDLSISDSTELLIMSGEAGIHYREGLKNFVQEGEILSGFVSLPGIVEARDFFLENNTAYLVMEYVEGQSLKDHMNQRRIENQIGMDYRTALMLLEPVIESLVEIHKKNLIHRDISPDNIIIGSDGQVKVIDFGAARAQMGNALSSLTVMVKHGYAPEEQYRAHGKQGAWTDVYALCATMYHMISGVLPEEGVERLYQDWVVPLCRLQLAVPVPEEISDVIAKGMSVHWENRYQSTEELYNALKQAEKSVEQREEKNAKREENEKLRRQQEQEERESEIREIRKKQEQLEQERQREVNLAKIRSRQEEARQRVKQENSTNRQVIIGIGVLLGIVVIGLLVWTMYPNSYHILIEQGEKAQDNYEYYKAEEYYEKAIEKDSSRKEAYEKILQVQVAQDDGVGIIKYVELAADNLAGKDRNGVLVKYEESYCIEKVEYLKEHPDDYEEAEKLYELYPDEAEQYWNAPDSLLERENDFRDYIENTLVPQYGVMDTKDKTGTTTSEGETMWYAEDLFGLLSANVKDFDGDGEKELLAVSWESIKGNVHPLKNLTFEIFEYDKKKNTVESAASKTIELPHAKTNITSQRFQTGCFSYTFNGTVYLALDNHFSFNEEITTLDIYRYDGEEIVFVGAVGYQEQGYGNIYVWQAEQEPKSIADCAFGGGMQSGDTWYPVMEFIPDDENGIYSPHEGEEAYYDKYNELVNSLGLLAFDERLWINQVRYTEGELDAYYHKVTSADVYKALEGKITWVSGIYELYDYPNYYLWRRDYKGTLDAYRTHADTETGAESVTVDKSAMYDAYLQKIQNTENFWHYSVYDIDNNGIMELIITSGSCEADSMFEFYSYNDGIVYCGETGAAHAWLVAAEDNKGLEHRVQHMGYASAWKIELNDYKIKETELFEGIEMGNSYEWSQAEKVLTFSKDDLSGLEEVTK